MFYKDNVSHVCVCQGGYMTGQIFKLLGEQMVDR